MLILLLCISTTIILLSLLIILLLLLCIAITNTIWTVTMTTYYLHCCYALQLPYCCAVGRPWQVQAPKGLQEMAITGEHCWCHDPAWQVKEEWHCLAHLKVQVWGMYVRTSVHDMIWAGLWWLLEEQVQHVHLVMWWRLIATASNVSSDVEHFM